MVGIPRLSANSSDPGPVLQLPASLPMPPSPWATPEQLVFLVAEDAQWATTKAGQGTLKSFYARTTNAFLEKWPITPDAKFVDEANGNMDRAKQLAEDNLLKVRSKTPATWLCLT